MPANVMTQTDQSAATFASGAINAGGGAAADPNNFVPPKNTPPSDPLKLTDPTSSTTGNYYPWTQQQQAGLNLSQDASQANYLNAKANQIQGSAALNTGYIGQQVQGVQDLGKITTADLARQAATAQQGYKEGVHQATGGFAAQGAMNSDVARQTLGNKGDQQWAQLQGGLDQTQPWLGNGKGDLYNQLQDTYAGLYSQGAKANVNEQLQLGGLYNQLGNQNLSTQLAMAQLGVQQNLLGQNQSTDQAIAAYFNQNPTAGGTPYQSLYGNQNVLAYG